MVTEQCDVTNSDLCREQHMTQHMQTWILACSTCTYASAYVDMDSGCHSHRHAGHCPNVAVLECSCWMHTCICTWTLNHT